MKAKAKWISGLGFENQIREHRFFLDAARGTGGDARGPSPKEVLLSSIICCSGMDVAGLLRKGKVSTQSFDVSAEAQTTETHPRIFKQIDVLFEFIIETHLSTEILDQIKGAVEISMTKYCGVSAMITPTSPIFYTVVINGEIEGRGKAQF